MSHRAFLFCDICNPQAIRVIEMRRGSHGRDPRMGRRVIDGRSWFDGDEDAARRAGWLCLEDGHHVCPICHASIRKLPLPMRDRLDIPDALLQAIEAIESV